MNPHKGRGSQGDESHLHIDIDLVDVQPSAGVLPLAPHSLFKHTHTHTLSHKHTWKENNLSTGSVLALSWPFPPSELFCTCCSLLLLLQSHISSGSSWGLRMPGTDIWSLCFSSWAWRRAVSLSSRNRSVVSSPANSCRTTQAEAQQRSHQATGFTFKLGKDKDFLPQNESCAAQISTTSLHLKSSNNLKGVTLVVAFSHTVWCSGSV